MKLLCNLRPSFKMCLVCFSADQTRRIGRLEGKKESVVPESTNSDKTLWRTVQVQTKIFIMSSLVRVNTVCHLTLRTYLRSAVTHVKLMPLMLN